MALAGIPGAGISTIVAPSSAPNASVRIVRQVGVEVVFTQSSAVTYFDFQTMLVTLNVFVGLLAGLQLFVDTVMIHGFCFRMRHVYKQYKVQTTVDFSDLHDNLGDGVLKETLDKFRLENNLVDPVPPTLEALLKFKTVRPLRSIPFSPSSSSSSLPPVLFLCFSLSLSFSLCMLCRRTTGFKHQQLQRAAASVAQTRKQGRSFLWWFGPGTQRQ